MVLHRVRTDGEDDHERYIKTAEIAARFAGGWAVRWLPMPPDPVTYLSTLDDPDRAKSGDAMADGRGVEDVNNLVDVLIGVGHFFSKGSIRAGADQNPLLGHVVDRVSSFPGGKRFDAAASSSSSMAGAAPGTGVPT